MQFPLPLRLPCFSITFADSPALSDALNEYDSCSGYSAVLLGVVRASQTRSGMFQDMSNVEWFVGSCLYNNCRCSWISTCVLLACIVGVPMHLLNHRHTCNRCRSASTSDLNTRIFGKWLYSPFLLWGECSTAIYEKVAGAAWLRSSFP